MHEQEKKKYPHHKYTYSQKSYRALMRRLNHRLGVREDEQRFHSVRKTKNKYALEFFIMDTRDGRIVEDALSLKQLYYMDSLAPNRKVSQPGQSRRAMKLKQQEYRERILPLHGPVRHIVINGQPVEAQP